MSKRILLPLALLALATPLYGQARVGKPVTESQLFRTDSDLGGEPVKKKKPDDVTGTLKNAAPPSGDQKTPGETIITSEEATFSQAQHQAIFTINVTVVNPEFNMTCEKLTAYLKHDDTKGKGKAGSAPATPAPTPQPKIGPDGKPVKPPRDSGGLDHAIAEGKVVIIQDKVDADGNPTHSVGHARKAFYDAKTGNVRLEGMPDVSQGVNSVVATAEETYIIMNNDSQTAEAHGPSKTYIRDTGDATKPNPNSPTAPQ